MKDVKTQDIFFNIKILLSFFYIQFYTSPFILIVSINFPLSYSYYTNTSAGPPSYIIQSSAGHLSYTIM